MQAVIDRVDEAHTIEDDGGKPRGRTERMCGLTRATRPVGELIRFVRAPDGAVIPDLKAVLPGRGVWLSARRSVIAEAVRKRLFSRAFKAEARADEALVATVDTLLLQRARDSLSLANKAGQAVSGFVQVEAALKAGAAVLLHAADAADDGCHKLDRLFLALGGQEVGIVKVFSGHDLDLALARSNVVHAALMDGSAAQACLARIVLLSAYRESGTGGTASPAGYKQSNSPPDGR